MQHRREEHPTRREQKMFFTEKNPYLKGTKNIHLTGNVINPTIPTATLSKI